MSPTRLLAVLLVSATILAGCAAKDKGSGSDTAGTDASDFKDLGAKATATTGVLIGVVVDEAIRPIKGANVTLQRPDGTDNTKVTDAQGRFAFSDLPAGTYFLKVKALLYTSSQTSAEVIAGDENPEVVRVQLTRLFAQNPYTEQLKFDGYLVCSISFPAGTTCVNDYTRLVGGTVPGCEGGCLKQYNVSRTAGNIREYVTSVGPGWQQIVFEAYWEASTQLGHGLTISVSFFTRPDASHFYGTLAMDNPLRLQFDVNQTAPGQQEEPKLINWQGQNDLFVLYNDGGGPGSVTLNQKFTSLQTNFYYGTPQDGWSFVKGDPLPF